MGKIIANTGTNTGTTDNFYLDLQHMDEIVGRMDELAIRCTEIAADYYRDGESGLEWEGAARAMYDTEMERLKIQLCDVADSIAQISQKLVQAGTAYMRADTDLAKSLDGKTSRFN